jgi:VIT1/CCC1 family predicted Fe2+/Mn2+ transporter
MQKPSDSTEPQRLLRNWRAERDSAALYQALAAIERNASLRNVFNKLAASEQDHADFWEDRLRSAGRPIPPFKPSLRTRMLIQLARQFGVAFVIPSITSRELTDRDHYSEQDDARAAGLAKEERGHAAVMRTIAIQVPVRREQGAQTGIWSGSDLANNLRAAVLGANDGLVSNFCLLMGVAGGGGQRSAILLTGVAGLFAGACAMALGEWLSVTNTREMAARQIDQQVESAQAGAAHETKELALIYEAKGMSEEDARRAADKLRVEQPSEVDTLVRAALAIEPGHLGANPESAAAVSFALFALGASAPLAPFFVLPASPGIMGSVCVSLAALFALGLVTSFFNGRSPVFSGARQVLIGAGAALITYGVGRLFGAVIS